MISRFKRKGFTLIELMVVVAMIAVIAAAMSVSVSGAQERAKIQKATVEVKAITQAILAYENFSKSGLPVLGSATQGAEVNASNLGFLLGKNGTDATGDRMPVILQAALTSGGKLLDPWGTPYTVVIAKGTIYTDAAVSTLRTGFSLPNINRLTEEERK